MPIEIFRSSLSDAMPDGNDQKPYHAYDAYPVADSYYLCTNKVRVSGNACHGMSTKYCCPLLVIKALIVLMIVTTNVSHFGHPSQIFLSGLWVCAVSVGCRTTIRIVCIMCTVCTSFAQRSIGFDNFSKFTRIVLFVAGLAGVWMILNVHVFFICFCRHCHCDV